MQAGQTGTRFIKQTNKQITTNQWREAKVEPDCQFTSIFWIFLTGVCKDPRAEDWEGENLLQKPPTLYYQDF